MFELDHKLTEISKYFNNILIEYGFKILLVDKYEVHLENASCKVVLTTGRYYCDFAIKFIDNNSGEKYHIIELMDKKGLTVGKKILTDEEIDISNSIKDEIDNNLYTYSVVIGRYFTEFLEGDFSSMNKES